MAFACIVCSAIGSACFCDWEQPGASDDLTALCVVLGANPRKRARNIVRDRQGPLAEVATWTDVYFKRQFRITRAEFAMLRESIAPLIRVRDDDMARRSSPGGAVPLETKMYVTLRMLAGAMYLDMVWYGISTEHVNEYMMEVVTAMNKCAYLDNIKLPTTEAEVRAVQEEWEELSKRRTGGISEIPGTIGAVDGYQTAIRKVSHREALSLGIQPDAFYYRKGFHALLAQGVCNAYGQFMYWGMQWPGTTNDIVAYRQSGLADCFDAGKPMSAGHFVMDEAYSSIGGDHHLCPFSKHQLRTARARDAALYDGMLVFNNRLSSQRITVERAFGMLLRRFGIFWHDMAYSVADTIAITTACVRLHNLGIARWRELHGARAADTIAEAVPVFAAGHEAQANRRAAPHGAAAGDNDAAVIARVEAMANAGPVAPQRAAVRSSRRDELVQRLRQLGYRINPERRLFEF